MTDDPQTPERFSLSRWSRRKHEAARAETSAPAESGAGVSPPAITPVAAPVASVAPEAAPPAPEPLPPVESLTIDSDFGAFMQPKVDEALKRAALKKLFSDPHFNVMDGLDIYIGDYTQADPMPAGMLDRLANVYGKLTEEVAEKPVADGQVASATTAPPPALPPPTSTPASPDPSAGQTALPIVADGEIATSQGPDETPDREHG
jgi:hypothetical protein